jgi:hypothetical protein
MILTTWFSQAVDAIMIKKNLLLSKKDIKNAEFDADVESVRNYCMRKMLSTKKLLFYCVK